ncbi:MAG: sensor histidine kinase [Pseudomonadota bacterium]
MTDALSLRLRLVLIILMPLMFLAIPVGLWQLDTARRTAAEVFDRALLSAAIAVSNDVTLSGGDALSPRTRRVLADTSGGRVYYHVYAPDGVIVAGYATPPVGIPRAPAQETGPAFFAATYLGRDVSGVRLQNRTQIDGFSGIFTTTVWQDTAVRRAFSRQLVGRSLAAILGLILSVALIVWFGVRLGLAPLTALQHAIERRSSDDLAPIRRVVPREVRGIVETLNSLFSQVSRSMTAQSEFISNAAHQLRNPIAGVLSLAEAVERAPNPEEARIRARDLLEAARETADLTQRLLTMERAKEISPANLHERVDLAACLVEWMPGFAPSPKRQVEIALDVRHPLEPVLCDPIMLREALSNLVHNAFLHGGPDLSKITVKIAQENGWLRLAVADDGAGMPESYLPLAVQRFSQGKPASGSGLGLSIVAAVAEGHGGKMEILPQSRGVEIALSLPCHGCPSMGATSEGSPAQA